MKPTVTLRLLLQSSIDDIERHWNENIRASIAAALVVAEMLVYCFWYFICFYFDLIDDNTAPQVQQTLMEDIKSHTIVMPMLGLTIAVLAYATLMCPIFLRIKPKTRQWFLLQTSFVLVYFAYSTVFIQVFGENTVITGLNLSGEIILGLFLLERSLVLMAFLLGIAAFIFISLNRKLHWINLGMYASSSAQDYWFWIITYIFFTICKVIATVVIVDWILKILGKQQAKIYELSQRDTLTTIDNRRTIYCYLNYIWERRKCQCVSLIYFDLDKFKDINDMYGHTMGDKTLVEVCRIVTNYLMLHLNQTYRFGRLGGEEFVIILPNIETQQALMIAENLRQIIKTHAIMTKDFGQSFFITASFGVATLFHPKSSYQSSSPLAEAGFINYLKNHLQVSPDLPTALQDLINMASDGTRIAKNMGRDRVIAGGVTTSPQV